ncbi:MAG: DUF4835 family protein [Deltaproteobacteria bacterium]
MNFRFVLTIFFISAFCIVLPAQEFNMTVRVQTPKLKMADAKLFKQMEKTITEFYNKSKWTNDDFEDNEKIEANLVINITNDLSATAFIADFSFQCLRPVYKSSYKTLTLNWIDKNYSFSFEEMQPVNISTNVFIDDLTAILTYYGYMMLGLDYDSFSNFGGTSYFEKAREVVDNVPLTNQNIKTWNIQGKDNNKYWLIENIANPKYRNFRQSFYEYHRLSLDIMAEETDKGRAMMTSALKEIKAVADLAPQNPVIIMFMNAKKTELIEIFKPAGYSQRSSIYTLLSELDPSAIDEYKEIMK